jgi:ABC-type multidrug transport system ATPase subunit
MYLIEVENISKSYHNKQALKDISFQVEKGEIFGLIGPDGAGKSTLFDILVTLLLPDKGQASICNFDVVRNFKKIRKILGYMPGKFSLYQDLTVYENLSFFASIFGNTIEENYDLISDIYVQLEPFKNRPASKLSGGMKQKLALCCALVHKPSVLLLDEPTTGVDPVSRKEFWQMLKKFKDFGISMLVSTPYMDEANLCDKIALIQNGSIMAIDTPNNIANSFHKKIFAIEANSINQLINDLRLYSGTHSCFSFGQNVHLVVNDNNITEKNIKDYLISKQHENISINLIKASIEDTFMELMKNNSNSN